VVGISAAAIRQCGVMLRWHLQEGRQVIPKSTKPARMAENIDVFDFELTISQQSAIDALDTAHRGGPEPEAMTLGLDPAELRRHPAAPLRGTDPRALRQAQGPDLVGCPATRIAKNPAKMTGSFRSARRDLKHPEATQSMRIAANHWVLRLCETREERRYVEQLWGFRGA
jgi:hypothetical protein